MDGKEKAVTGCGARTASNGASANRHHTADRGSPSGRAPDVEAGAGRADAETFIAVLRQQPGAGDELLGFVTRLSSAPEARRRAALRVLQAAIERSTSTTGSTLIPTLEGMSVTRRSVLRAIAYRPGDRRTHADAAGYLRLRDGGRREVDAATLATVSGGAK